MFCKIRIFICQIKLLGVKLGLRYRVMALLIVARCVYLFKQCPVVGSQLCGQTQGLQPSSPKPQKLGRQWLQLKPPTPNLQWHWPLLWWHQAPTFPGSGGKDPWGSHQQPAMQRQGKKFSFVVNSLSCLTLNWGFKNNNSWSSKPRYRFV